MIRPNLYRFICLAVFVLFSSRQGSAQQMMMPVQYSAPQNNHYITGDHSLWDESRPIERFLTNAAQNSWLRLEMMYLDFGSNADGMVGAPVSGLQNNGLGALSGRDIPVSYVDNLNGGLPVGDVLIPTLRGMDQEAIRGIRGTWGMQLDGADMELSFFGTEQKTMVADYGSIAGGRIARFNLDPTIDPELGLAQSGLNPGQQVFAPNYAIPLLTDGLVQDFAGANALLFNDTLKIQTGSQMWGTELNLLTTSNAPGGAGLSWQWLGGFRYLNLDERFAVSGTNGAFNGVDAIVPDQFTTIASDTINNIYGPQLGARLALTSKYLTFSATPRVMMGLNDHQSSVRANPLGLAESLVADREVEFATVTQLNLAAEIHVNPQLSLFGGWEMIFITDVTQPKENIVYDSTVSAVGGVTTVDIGNSMSLRDFLATGFNFGATFRY